MTGPEDEPNPSVNSDIDSMAGEDDETGFDESPVEYWADCDFDPEDEDDDYTEVYDDEDEDEMTDALPRYIDDLRYWKEKGVGGRLANALALNKIHTVEQLRALGMPNCLRMPHFGMVSAGEVADKIGWGDGSTQPERPPDNARIADALERIAKALETR